MSNACDDDIEPGKLFVGGLSWETTTKTLTDYFSKFGEVTDATVMADQSSKKPRGFGFVTFADPASVTEVLKVSDHEIDHKKVDPKLATVKPPKPKKVFLGGIAAETTIEMIKSCFEPYGEVKEVELKYDKSTNRMRGFGFVTFDDADVVTRVCETHFFVINGKRVEAKSLAGRGYSQSADYGQRMPYRGGQFNGYAQGGYPRQQAQHYGGGGYGYGYQQANTGYAYGGGAQSTGYGGGSAGYDQYGQSANGQQAMTGYPTESYSSYSSSRGETTGYPTQQYHSYQQQQQQQPPYGGAQGGPTGYGHSQQTGYNNYPSVR